VLVGIGVSTQREEDARALEPLDLMIDAVRRAGKDSGAEALLAGVQRVAVPKGRWRYQNPGGETARSIGAQRSVSVLSTVGVLQQTLIGDACLRIAQGEVDTALVVGGDAGYRLLRSKIAGAALRDRQQADTPDVTLAPHDELRHPAELQAGMKMPVGLYAIIESAFRAAQGWTVDAQRDAIAAMYARFSEIAEGNPHAWKRRRVAPADIRDASARNAMQAFPYTKLHCSTWNVDQAAALIFCSAGKALALGIPRSQWIHPLASTESNHMVPVSARDDLARCPGASLAGRAALEAGDLHADDLDLVNLYSCFPVAVETYASELGIDSSRDLTVTGGTPFAGGPYNNYVLQATARMVELLRAGPSCHGLVASVSGVLTKQGFGLWGREPGRNGFVHADVTDAVARAARTREIVDRYQGDATVARYTIFYEPSQPPRGVVVVDLRDKRRAVAHTENAELIATMQSGEFCGMQVKFESGNTFTLMR